VWAPKPIEHLDKAKEKARNHDVECFDHDTGKYEVTVRGGTADDGASRPSRCYVVVLVDFSCTCGKIKAVSLSMFTLHCGCSTPRL